MERPNVAWESRGCVDHLPSVRTHHSQASQEQKSTVPVPKATKRKGTNPPAIQVVMQEKGRPYWSLKVAMELKADSTAGEEK